MRAWCALLVSLAACAPSPAYHITVIPSGGDPGAVAVADLNHDGHPDIIAANENGGTITVLLGDGKVNSTGRREVLWRPGTITVFRGK